MILQIDMGNSRIKWRLQDEARTLGSGIELLSAGWSWLNKIEDFCPASVQVASVLSDVVNDSLLTACEKYNLPAPQFAKSELASSVVDLQNGYEDFSQLGVDRWLLMIAARARSQLACVVVDGGSALTIDVIAADGVHQGGYIAPGLAIMRQGLKQGTARVQIAEGSPWGGSNLGSTTASCIDNALLQMGEGLIRRACEQAGVETTVLFLTGGDAGAWGRGFETAVTVPDMVLEGLGVYFGG